MKWYIEMQLLILYQNFIFLHESMYQFCPKNLPHKIQLLWNEELWTMDLIDNLQVVPLIYLCMVFMKSFGFNTEHNR